jgi:LuxR family maltose regulon positive regulatory protein
MAAECLQRIHEHAESTHNVRVLIEVLALEALLHAANNDEKAALETLEKSLALARPGGYIRIYVDLGPDMADLLRRMQNREPFVEYIASILQAFGDASDHAAEPEGRKQLAEPLTNREAEILELLAKRYSNKEIAAELVISPATVKGHTINLYQKLSVHNRRDAVWAARALGLIPSS